jgi:GNAT superfamily N-acetyltransferase
MGGEVRGILNYSQCLTHPLADFEHIEFGYIEVHKKYRGLGLAREMLKRLDTEDDLTGKVLRRTAPASPKLEGFSDVVTQTLQAQQYAILPHDKFLRDKPLVARGEVGISLDDFYKEDDKKFYFKEY